MYKKVVIIYFCFFKHVHSQDNLKLLGIPKGGACMNNGVQGKCVSFIQCPTVIADTENGFDLMQKYPLCSFEDAPVICCTSCDLVENVSDAMVTKSGRLYWASGMKSWDKCLEYSEKYALSCAKGWSMDVKWNATGNCHYLDEYESSGIKAVNGYDAKRQQFPHMALLGFGDNAKDAQFSCGGSIISEDFVLTAAHCGTLKKAAELKLKHVAVGILKRNDPVDYWQLRTVAKFIRHPKYASPSVYYDIALVKVNKPFDFSDSVRPACIYSKVFGDEMTSGVKFTATGWGRKGSMSALAETLQVVDLVENSKTDCKRQFKKMPRRKLQKGYRHKSQMCFRGANTIKPGDTCQGDSGGPLQFFSQLTCTYAVIGVTSSGQSICGMANDSALYARVEHYVSWIETEVWP